MKLERFKEKDNKKTGIVIFTIVCILLVSGAILYRTFAIFEVKTNQNVINGTVQDPGNIYFAFYVDNEIQKEMPDKDNGFVLDEETSYCGINGSHDDSITVSLTEDYTILVHGVTTSRTKCNLYFVKGKFIQGKGIPIVEEGDGLYEIKHDELTGTVNDDGFRKTEYRYAGKNPNNYITFNGETWRIIGLVNVMTDTNKVEQRVKIVKNEGIVSNFSWDTSETDVNGGYGINEWSQADLMKLLNPGYEKESGGSLYWNTSLGTCYNGAQNVSTSCDFTTNGFKDKYEDLIEEVFWNTGSNGTHYIYDNIDVNEFYEIERSEYTANELCADETYCNDNIERQTTWKGKVGLIYPSDYGFASSNVVENGVCKTAKMYSWNEHLECNDTNWLPISDPKQGQWTLTPCNAQRGAFDYSAIDVFSIRDNQVRDEWICGGGEFYIRPVVYLKQDVLILYGNGDSEHPYVLVQEQF